MFSFCSLTLTQYVVCVTLKEMQALLMVLWFLFGSHQEQFFHVELESRAQT